MPRYAALLRAINVGGHTVKMSELCALFERAKLANVRSVIASGNVLFDARSTDVAALERRIETTLRDALGDDVETFVRTPDDLDAVVAHEPFWRTRGRSSDTAITPARFARALGRSGTARNVTTGQKLAARIRG